MQENKVTLRKENRDGKVYIVFYSGNNHICGNVAVANEGRLPEDLYAPEDILKFFLKKGYQV